MSNKTNIEIEDVFSVLELLIDLGVSSEVSLQSILCHKEDIHSLGELLKTLHGEDAKVQDFITRLDYEGPFCPLSNLRKLIEDGQQEKSIAGTNLFNYAKGIFESRSFYDNTWNNDTASGFRGSRAEEDREPPLC